jgi:hypothetical protein
MRGANINFQIVSEDTMKNIRSFAGAQVNPVQGKIDVALSQFAQMYRNNTLVAEMLFPRVEVMKESDLFWLFGIENQALRENVLRAPGAAAERIQQTLSKTPYSTTDHSLARLITDEERELCGHQRCDSGRRFPVVGLSHGQRSIHSDHGRGDGKEPDPPDRAGSKRDDHQ